MSFAGVVLSPPEARRWATAADPIYERLRIRRPGAVHAGDPDGASNMMIARSRRAV